jgi:hypothetical protein
MLSLVLAGTAAAQTPLAGTWQGRLEAAPGQPLTIQFVIKAAPAGGYTVVVTSPDDGAIKNVPAKSVKYADSKLTLEVPSLSGSYAGTLRNGALEGQWLQAGTKLPLTLRPLEEAFLTKADMDQLRGEWHGTLSGPGGNVTIVMRFSTAPDGEIRSTVDVPEQGAKDLPVKDVALDDGYFAAAIPTVQAKIAGTLKGEQIVAQWNQMGMSLPITFKKGKYVAATNYLDLPAAARDQLKGSWKGTLNGLAVRVRFETDAQGRTQGFFDSLQQNMLNLPIKSARLTGTAVVFELSVGAVYSGELAGGKMTGQWTQTGVPKPFPLELTREK